MTKTKDDQQEHTGSPSTCPRCVVSTRPACQYCGHALTGGFTNDGWTECENCREAIWLGVGNDND